MSVEMTVPIGKLVDKITVLEIMSKRQKDNKHIREIHSNLVELRRRARKFPVDPDIVRQLRTVNEAIWVAQTRLRGKIDAECFDEDYVFLATNVVHLHDERKRIRKSINSTFVKK